MIKFKAIVPKKGALEKDIAEALKRLSDKLEKAQSIECPDHHQRAEIVATSPGAETPYEITACCQKLMDQVLAALK